MDETDVRSSAQAVADALVAGDVDGAIEIPQRRAARNLGEVVALLPLPATEATIVAVDRASSSFVVVVHVVGEASEVGLQTRWKDRNGKPGSWRSAT